MTRLIRPAAPERRDTSAAGGLITRAFSCALKAAGEEGEIEGYGSVFGVVDSYDDIVAPGAFAMSLAEHRANGTLPAMLWQHDPSEPIGVWTEMAEDDRGLRVRGRLILETERGRQAHALLKADALRGLSIGFMSKAWAYEKDSGIRTLTQVDLWEVSLVTFPANTRAKVESVKKCAVDDIAAPKDAERTLREAGFSKADATALVARVMRMGEARREAADATAKAAAAADRLLRAMTI